MLSGKDLEKIPVIIADVSSETSLADMCKQAKIVLNCVGPVSNVCLSSYCLSLLSSGCGDDVEEVKRCVIP